MDHDLNIIYEYMDIYSMNGSFGFDQISRN